MIRTVRPRSLGFAVCLGLLACSGMEDPQPPEPREASPPSAFASDSQAPEPASARPAATVRRRALLIGINDYAAAGNPMGPRRVQNLSGAVNDVTSMGEMLVAQYGFARQDVLVLTDQAATRDAILRAIQSHLEAPAGKGDVLLFYFSGHGSQVANPGSDEDDKMDETIVPADLLQGKPDIRDKDLRLLFNRILDRGAYLTIVLDSCHSGSGARGAFDATPIRSILPDRWDLRDSSPPGPRPENRGALVLSASQDYDSAYESADEHGIPHGAFSLALIRSLRDSRSGEPAEETFLRARARLQAERRFQEPVLGGLPRVRRAPFLGQRAGQRNGRMVVAVESVKEDGTAVLQGGLANGLTEGSELRLPGTNPEVRVRITKVDGFSRSEGQVQPAGVAGKLKTGDLVEIVQWTAPAGGPLKVWMPEAGDARAAVALARELAREAPRQGIRWIEDPTRQTPTHVLRWRGPGWDLLAAQRLEPLGPEADASTVLAKIDANTAGQKPFALFVQLPAPRDLAGAIDVGAKSNHSGVEPTRRPEDADYVLAGRLAAGGVEYAWLRPGVAETDQNRTSLPVRTEWRPLGPHTGDELRDAVLRLRQIHAWLHLETPPGAASDYEIAVRHADGDGSLITDRTLYEGEKYQLVLRAREGRPPAHAEHRYFYVFVLDRDGRSTLLYPNPASPDQNRFPLSSGAPTEISLGQDGVFRIGPPYGVDTCFLLTSDERIPDPWILESDGVRPRGPKGKTPLAELLSITGGSMRGWDPIPTPAVWSVERTPYLSVAKRFRNAQ